MKEKPNTKYKSLKESTKQNRISNAQLRILSQKFGFVSSGKMSDTDGRLSQGSSIYRTQSYDKENNSNSHHTSIDSKKSVDLSGLRDSLLPEDEEPDIIPTSRNNSNSSHSQK